MEAQAARCVDRERLEEYEKRFDGKLEALKADINRLQEGSAAVMERRTMQSEHKQTSQWTASTVITVVFGLLGTLTFLFALLQFFLKSQKP